MGQSHFVYIQSENSDPFYVKLNDSLISSTQAGYLILPQLQKGVYPVIIGLAKKKMPEAAFKISIGDSGNKGYLLKPANGKLRLQDIQSKSMLEPEVVATSAGNRILPDAIEDISKEAKKEEKEMKEKASDNPPLATESPAKADRQPSDKDREDKTKETDGNPFEKMLNAVTGGGDEPVVAKETGDEEEKPEEEKLTQQEPAIEQEEPEPAEEKEEKPLAFDKLFSKNKDNPPPKQENTTPPEKEEEPEVSHAFEDLVFIDFDDENTGQDEELQDKTEPGEDTLITSGKELKKEEKLQRREEKKKERAGKGISFDDLLAKIDTAAGAVKSSSLAKPFLSKNEEVKDSGDTTNIECDEVADQEYFNKVLRKMAAKSSEQSMLRTATRYFADNKCYTVAQLKQLAYLFATDNYRFRFLKVASGYCAEKDRQNELVNTLSDKAYQKRLSAYIR